MTEDNKKRSSYWKYILTCCAIFIASLVYLDKKRENDRAMSMIENITTSVLPRKQPEEIDSARLQEMLKDVQDKGYKRGFDQGKDAGFSEGEKEAQKRIAIKALIEGVSCEVVSRIANLDLESVKQLERTYTDKSIEPIIQNKNNSDKNDAIQEQEQEAGEHIGDHGNATTNEPIPADEVEEQDVDQRE